MTEEMNKFLQALARWQGVASPHDLAPQISQEQNSARQRCKRNGFVTFHGGYWRLTDTGRTALRQENFPRC